MKRSIVAAACAVAIACLLTFGSTVRAGESHSLQVPAAQVASADIPVDLAQQSQSALPGMAAALQSTTAQPTMVAQGYYRPLFRRPLIRPRYYNYYRTPRTLQGYPYVNYFTQPYYPGYPGFYGGGVHYIPYNGIYY